eukprot:1218316-Amphidinium_carterae.1
MDGTVLCTYYDTALVAFIDGTEAEDKYPSNPHQLKRSLLAMGEQDFKSVLVIKAQQQRKHIIAIDTVWVLDLYISKGDYQAIRSGDPLDAAL